LAALLFIITPPLDQVISLTSPLGSTLLSMEIGWLWEELDGWKQYLTD